MPYTPITWVEGVTTLGPTNMNHIEQGIASLSAPAPSATPPASPADGDLWYLPADSTNGVVWQFRYNAGSSSAYKWEFIGGPQAYVQVLASEATTTTGTWLDLTTVGPQFAAPRGGDYCAWGQAQPSHTAAGALAYVGIAVNAGAPSVAGVFNTAAANQGGVVPIQGRFTGLVAGDNIRMRYHNGTAGTATYVSRLLSVVPIRVS